MGQTSRVLAVFPDFEYAGKRLKVERRTYETEGKIEVWLEERALAAVQRHADSLSPYEYHELLRIWDEDVAACVYSFDGLAYHKAMTTSAGLFARCLLDLKQANPRVSEDFVRGLWDDETRLPTGRTHPQTGKPVTERYADRLVVALQRANAPLADEPAGETPAAGETPPATAPATTAAVA
jgi:hypothetical protein